MRVCGGALGLVLALFVLGAAAPAAAQAKGDLQLLQREIQALRHGQAAIRKELRELRAILLRQAKGAKNQPEAFSPTGMTVAGAPFIGRADAPVTLIEFSDFQCPFCQRHADRVLPRLIEQYVETGRVKYVMRQFPIEQIHPFAFKASEAALCAGGQGQYWQMHDLIFANQKQLAVDDMKSHAAALALDVAAFETCLESDKYAEQVRRDMADGHAAGVRGTPAFFLGLTDGEDQIKAVKSIRGAQPLAVFQQMIDQIASQGSPNRPSKSHGSQLEED